MSETKTSRLTRIIVVSISSAAFEDTQVMNFVHIFQFMSATEPAFFFTKIIEICPFGAAFDFTIARHL
jgi:hypothetical protein